MPQHKSSQSKASKAAKAILHPKSTLAAVKANHAGQSRAEPASANQDAKPTESPAPSIRKAPSNASISSTSSKPLVTATSTSTQPSPATAAASLPVSAQPSVLAPAINSDILSMKKQSMDKTTSSQQSSAAAQVVPAAASPADSAKVSQPHGAAGEAPTPYVIDNSAATSAGQSAARPQTVAAVAESELASTPREKPATIPASDVVESKDLDAPANKDAKDFASEVASVVASSPPAADQKLEPEALAAPTPVTLPIATRAVQPDSNTQPAYAATADDAAHASSALVDEAAATAVAAANLSTFTPPELTRIQHNTFVSRPTDASRAAVRDLDRSLLPAPLRPIDAQRGIVRSPSHVVVFGWMDAPIRLVAKYAQPYTVLFPDATVLIQLSDGKSYLAREELRREQLQRIIAEITSVPTSVRSDDTIEAQERKDVGDSTITLIDHKEAVSTSSSDDGKDESREEGGFVIHSFSDGGAGNLALFLDEMARKFGSTSTRTAPKVHSLIMDSSPGKSNPRTGSVAFTMHLANRPRLRAIVQLLVYIGLYLMKIWGKIRGQPTRGELMRKRLNSLRSWSWVTASYQPKVEPAARRAEDANSYPPRMYMYTKADKLIPWQFVEEHAHHLGDIVRTQPRLVQMENEKEREGLVSANNVDGATQARGEKDCSVELRRWDTPAHCSIARADYHGYWAAVIDFYTRVLGRWS